MPSFAPGGWKFGGDLVAAMAERNRRPSSRIYGFHRIELTETDAHVRAVGGDSATTG
jgi:hypothetical protein